MKIKRFEFNMFPENCYVLWDETLEAVVIDPGCFYEEEKQALKNFIISNGLQVKHLLNTHLHLDHIFGNPFMLKEFGLKAEANQADEFWITKHPNKAACSVFSCRNRPCRWALTCTTETSSPSAIRNWKPSMYRDTRRAVLVYYCAADHCMFSGDVLFQGSIGRADLTGGNFDELIEHICSRLFILPNDTIVYPGHGAPTTIGIEKAENPFFR